MTIGKYAFVGAGSRIKNSIVLEDVVIKDHAVIINSIIGWSTHVGSWTRIEGILKFGTKNSSKDQFSQLTRSNDMKTDKNNQKVI